MGKRKGNDKEGCHRTNHIFQKYYYKYCYWRSRKKSRITTSTSTGTSTTKDNKITHGVHVCLERLVRQQLFLQLYFIVESGILVDPKCFS
jgi:hypothetical protein